MLPLGWAALAAGGILLAAFVTVCLFEREWRAAGVSAAVGATAAGFLTAALTIDHPARPWVVLGLLLVGLAGLLAVAVPLGSGPAGTRVKEPPARIDERDAVFHRFYRLAPGTADYAAYYRDRPALEAFDREVRRLPDLGSPGSRSYHRASSAYLHALFALCEQVGRSADRPTAGLEAEPLPLGPGEASRRLAGLAQQLGADRVGCTRLEPAWIYSHIGRGPGAWGAPIALDHGFALVIGVEMDWELVRHAPGTAQTTATAQAYLEAGTVASVLARVIQLWGYRARAHLDGNYRVLCVPLAERAGLGETGRHGLLIAPGCGPRLRLAVVTTDLELAPDTPVRLGVQAFCRHCKKCALNCPSGAVDAGDKALHNGVEKWRTERDRCYRLWRKLGTDCGLCISVCPFAKPATAPHQLVRWAIAHNPFARRVALWADDLLYGRRPRNRAGLPAWHAEPVEGGARVDRRQQSG